MKESSTYSVADITNKTECFIISSNPSVTLSPESTPRFTNNLKTIKEGLSVLEREFMEFREKTMASLHQNKIVNNQPNNETHTLILQQRDQIRELQQTIRKLEENN